MIIEISKNNITKIKINSIAEIFFNKITLNIMIYAFIIYNYNIFYPQKYYNNMI